MAISSKADDVDVEFWRAVLGYSPMADDKTVDESATPAHWTLCDRAGSCVYIWARPGGPT